MNEMDSMHNLMRRPSRGSAMVIGFALVILLLAMAMAFASRMSTNQLRSESDIAGERAYEMAQTSNTLKVEQVWGLFKTKSPAERVSWVGGEDLNANGVLDPGEDVNGNKKLDPPHAPDYQDGDWVLGSNGDSCTRIKVLSLLKNKWAIVRFTTWARVKDEIQNRDVVRKVQRAVRFSLKPGGAFDYSFFSDNNAVLDGQQITVFGPIGANGDITLNNNPVIDGKISAAKNPKIGAMGNVEGVAAHDPLSDYMKQLKGNPLLRPTNPAAPSEDVNNNGLLDPGEDRNKNGVLDDFKFSLGYDGNQPINTGQPLVQMPTLGDLSMYKDFAHTYVRPERPDLGETGGTLGSIVKQLTQPGLDPTNPANYTVLINRTYGDSGEHGMTALPVGKGVAYTNLPHKIDHTPGNGWKNGNVALIGTKEQPLVIMGPVVVTNDLVIKGTITGQGTFYVGRNLHVVGDIDYKDPPQWKTNDINFSTTSALNASKDAVGFTARGNIILGNYTDMDISADQWNVVKLYMTPPYVKPSAVSNEQDVQVGYGTGAVNGVFNGDYTQLDGDKMYLDNGTAPAKSNRAYFQSTFSEAYIKSIAVKPKSMHGIFYAGHFFGGRGDYLTIFGSMITHDEGIVAGWGTTLIFDPRISQLEPSTFVNLSLPGSGSMDVMYWKDVPADDATPLSPDW